MNKEIVKRFSLQLMMLAVAGKVFAGELQVIDLGAGAKVVIKDGKVEVINERPPGGKSYSGSRSSRKAPDGGTITDVTFERDGKTIMRTIRVGSDGKVSITGGNEVFAEKGNGEAGRELTGKGWLGVHGVPVPGPLRDQLGLKEGEGALLDVYESGPAAGAGLRSDDILLRWNGKAIGGVDGMRKLLASVQPAATVALEGFRGGKPMKWKVTVGTVPAAKFAAGDAPAPGARMGTDAGAKGEDGDLFQSMLADPNVPEDEKASIRRMVEKLRQMDGEIKQEKK